MPIHFVEDRGGKGTTRQPRILPGLVSDLDGIFENQAAVTFETWEPGNDVKLPFHLTDAVYEGKDLADRRLLGCPLQASNRAHLMFWDAVMRRTENFIPKACAGTIHGQAS